ncbi:hypothetical protein BKA56DRAFT_621020 [Ilyonectria sp. MPI-CAGE-AT-0026]|nr:hypothetical protein BKA56DRAFT_621020 [Ilyonectria sp. MPI-CAGE-AT-0026]
MDRSHNIRRAFPLVLHIAPSAESNQRYNHSLLPCRYCNPVRPGTQAQRAAAIKDRPEQLAAKRDSLRRVAALPTRITGAPKLNHGLVQRTLDFEPASRPSVLNVVDKEHSVPQASIDPLAVLCDRIHVFWSDFQAASKGYIDLKTEADVAKLRIGMYLLAEYKSAKEV